MTLKQTILKIVYPIFNWLNIRMGKNNQILHKKSGVAPVSFYSLQTSLIDGTKLDFADLKNKKVLIVNTASDCGYTAQYEGLQALHQKYSSRLTIIGFPANDFGEQEKADNANIASFCKKNYGVGFLLAKKSSVIKKEDQHEVFKWLTDDQKNGWNDVAPGWNFCKYLIDENGELIQFFASAIEPTNEEIVKAIEQ